MLLVAKNETLARVHGFDAEDKIVKRYRKKDEQGKLYREIDLRKTGDADRREDRPDMFYRFFYSEKTEELRVTKDADKQPSEIEIIPLREDGSEGRWRWGFETSKANISELIARYMPQRGIWGVFEKDYLDGRAPVKTTSVWTFKDVNSERGTEDFISHGFDKEVFPRPKPLGTMRRILEIGILPGEDSIVLDLFAGSCTLAEASFQLSRDSRRFVQYIGIQLDEHLSTHKKEHAAALAFCDAHGFQHTIAEIGKERIRRAGMKIKAEAGVDAEKLDFGIRVLKIDTSNMKEVYYNPDAVTQEGLFGQIDNIKEDRKDEDLLFQVLLDWGVDLTLPIQPERIAGKTVYFVDQNALAACFEAGIDGDFVKALAERKPLRAVFRDSGYGSDSTKINVEQIFKLISPTTEVKTI